MHKTVSSTICRCSSTSCTCTAGYLPDTGCYENFTGRTPSVTGQKFRITSAVAPYTPLPPPPRRKAWQHPWPGRR